MWMKKNDSFCLTIICSTIVFSIDSPLNTTGPMVICDWFHAFAIIHTPKCHQSKFIQIFRSVSCVNMSGDLCVCARVCVSKVLFDEIQFKWHCSIFFDFTACQIQFTICTEQIYLCTPCRWYGKEFRRRYSIKKQ